MCTTSSFPDPSALARSPKASTLLNSMLNSHFLLFLTSQKLWDLDDFLLLETLSSLGFHDSHLSGHFSSSSFAGFYSSPTSQLLAVPYLSPWPSSLFYKQLLPG